MKLSQNFSLREMTQSQTALRNDIDNTPNESQIENLKALCENVLQPLRDYYEAPIKITSGYRSPDLCKILNSKITSQHCANNQLILEYYNDSDINSGWIHCSFKSGANRKESLTKDKAGYQKWE